MRTLLALLLLTVTGMVGANPGTAAWPTHDRGPSPRGFATIVVDCPRHGQRTGTDMVIRLHSDNPRAVVHLLLDGKVVGSDGQPMRNQPEDLNQVVPIQFREGLRQQIDVRNLAPGLHTIEIRPGTRGTELPHINRQELEFVAGSDG